MVVNNVKFLPDTEKALLSDRVKNFVHMALFWCQEHQIVKNAFLAKIRAFFWPKTGVFDPKKYGANHFKPSIHVFYKDMCCLG